MAFPVYWNKRTMAFRALLEADLIIMVRSWVVRIWLGLMAAQTLFLIAVSADGVEASEAIASLLGTFPIIWSTVVILISSGAVSGEAGVVADSILSKSVTRYEYILAKLSARLLTVMGLYLLVALPGAYIIPRQAIDDVSSAGVAWAVVLVGMTLLLLTSLAVSCSTLFNRTLVAVIVVWFLWYVSGGIFALLGLQDLSPLHLIDNLPDMTQGDYELGDQLHSLLGFGIPSIAVSALAILHFSRKDL